ncbi:SDR family oxidoreductase [Streptomyces sp. NPDC002643]
MKTVVVTGATSGIGQATALDLAAHGFRVIATARCREKAEKLTVMARERGRTLRTVLLDVTDPASCQDAVREIEDGTGGGPWALVNNAGIAPTGAFEDIGDADARAVLEVNLLGAARMARLLLPGMRHRGDGRIVQMSSLGGLVSVPYNGWYSASKHGLEALTDAMRVEISGTGVHVSLVEPGFIDTPMLSDGLDRLPPGARQTVSRLVAWSSPPGPEVVARVVRRALTAKSPRRRYRVGPGAPVAPLFATLPAALTDRVTRTALHLTGRF